MGTNGELKGRTCCLTKSDQCSSWFHWIPKEHLNCRCLILFWQMMRAGIFGDSMSSDFHPAAMTVEVVPFFARLAHASLEAIQYVWRLGHFCEDSVDGRLVLDVIYIAWLHFLCFSFQINPLKNEHGTQKWRFCGRWFWFSNRWFFRFPAVDFPGCYSKFFWLLQIYKGLTHIRMWLHRISCDTLHNLHKPNINGFFLIWMFPKIEVGPQNGWWKEWKTLLTMDDLGGKPIIFGNTHIPTWSYFFGKFPRKLSQQNMVVFCFLSPSKKKTFKSFFFARKKTKWEGKKHNNQWIYQNIKQNNP